MGDRLKTATRRLAMDLDGERQSERCPWQRQERVLEAARGEGTYVWAAPCLARMVPHKGAACPAPRLSGPGARCPAGHVPAPATAARSACTHRWREDPRCSWWRARTANRDPNAPLLPPKVDQRELLITRANARTARVTDRLPESHFRASSTKAPIVAVLTSSGTNRITLARRTRGTSESCAATHIQRAAAAVGQEALLPPELAAAGRIGAGQIPANRAFPRVPFTTCQSLAMPAASATTAQRRSSPLW
jgi:hypothetical protein